MKSQESKIMPNPEFKYILIFPPSDPHLDEFDVSYARDDAHLEELLKRWSAALYTIHEIARDVQWQDEDFNADDVAED